MMVLSASSIEALQETGTPFTLVLQAVDLGRDRHPADVDLRAAAAAVLPLAGYPLMALSILGLVLVLFVGTSQLRRPALDRPRRRPPAAVRAGQARS